MYALLPLPHESRGWVGRHRISGEEEDGTRKNRGRELSTDPLRVAAVALCRDLRLRLCRVRLWIPLDNQGQPTSQCSPKDLDGRLLDVAVSGVI